MPTATTPDGVLTENDLQTAMQLKKPERIAIVYSKIDGRIELVYSRCISPRHSVDIILQTLMPGVDERQHELIWVPYEEGNIPSPKRHRVVVDVNGQFLAVKPIQQFGFRSLEEAEEENTTASKDDEIEINEELLNSNIEVVTHVLDQIQDIRRLIQYRLSEANNQNRSELMQYFKDRGL